MSAIEWLQRAKKEKFAIGAFNVGNLETFKAVVSAAANKKSPIIIESSPGETEWMGAENIVDLARNYSREFNIPILVNLDHALTLEDCQQAIEAGYDLVHFDGSKLSLEENTMIAKKVVKLAHQKGILVEGEIDHIGGSSEFHQGSAVDAAKEIPLSSPMRVRQFVEETGVDIVAAFIGNVHGVFSEGGEDLRLDILDKLVAALPTTYFSLHGGSGIEAAQVKGAVERGITKVNINTEMRQAFRNELEEQLKEKKEEYAMYKLEGPVVLQVQKVVEGKIEIFGSERKI